MSRRIRPGWWAIAVGASLVLWALLIGVATAEAGLTWTLTNFGCPTLRIDTVTADTIRPGVWWLTGAWVGCSADPAQPGLENPVTGYALTTSDGGAVAWVGLIPLEFSGMVDFMLWLRPDGSGMWGYVMADAWLVP